MYDANGNLITDPNSPIIDPYLTAGTYAPAMQSAPSVTNAIDPTSLFGSITSGLSSLSNTILGYQAGQAQIAAAQTQNQITAVQPQLQLMGLRNSASSTSTLLLVGGAVLVVALLMHAKI